MLCSRREPGFYIIQRYLGSRLEPAEYCPDGFWYTIGDSNYITTADIYKVISSLTITVPDHG